MNPVKEIGKMSITTTKAISLLTQIGVESKKTKESHSKHGINWTNQKSRREPIYFS
jgi:hypothetical protein